MIRGKVLFCMVAVFGCLLAFSAPASGHNVFKKQLQAKYPNMKVTCNVCHVNKEPKTVRGNYGKLFSKTFENKTLTADFKAKKGAERKEFETTVMAPAFDKAFEKIKMMSFNDLVEAGVIDGISPKEGADDDDDDDDQS